MHKTNGDLPLSLMIGATMVTVSTDNRFLIIFLKYEMIDNVDHGK